MARPTEYKEEYIAKADEYLAEHKDEITNTTVNGNIRLKVKLPTLEGFALFIGVNKTSLYEWEKQHPEFSNALDKIRTEQHDRLLNSGLSGDYNSTIAKLVLSSNHGYAEKSEQKNEITLNALTDQQKETLDSLFTLDVDPKSTEQSNNGNTSGT